VAHHAAMPDIMTITNRRVW